MSDLTPETLAEWDEQAARHLDGTGPRHAGEPARIRVLIRALAAAERKWQDDETGQSIVEANAALGEALIAEKAAREEAERVSEEWCSRAMEMVSDKERADKAEQERDEALTQHKSAHEDWSLAWADKAAAEARVAELEAERRCDSLCELDVRRMERLKAAEAEAQRLRDGITALADGIEAGTLAFMADYEKSGDGISRRISGEAAALIVENRSVVAGSVRALLAPQVQDKPAACTCGWAPTLGESAHRGFDRRLPDMQDKPEAGEGRG